MLGPSVNTALQAESERMHAGSEPGLQEEVIHGPSCSLPILPGLQSKEAWAAMCIAALTGPAFCCDSSSVRHTVPSS